MATFRRRTALEQREFEANQQAGGFLRWLDRMDTELAEFLTVDAPEIGELSDPWGAEGLRLADIRARDTFGSSAALSLPEHADAVDRFTRFIGHVYCSNFEGVWRNVPFNAPDGQNPWPVVAHTFRAEYIDPFDQLGLAFVKPTRKMPLRPGGELAWVHGNFSETYSRWVAAGRPSYEQWQKIDLDFLLGR